MNPQQKAKANSKWEIIAACMNGDDLEYCVMRYRSHVCRMYPNGKITSASAQERTF